MSFLAVACIMIGGWWVIRQSDRLAGRETPYGLGALLYDEFDFSAMALRGLNAELGRLPGATNPPRMVPHSAFSSSIEAPRPLKDRFFLEYPHAALLIFRAGYWIQPDWKEAPIPPGLPDAAYHNLAVHEPETSSQQETWSVLARARDFYFLVMVVAWFSLLGVLAAVYPPESRDGWFLLALPAAIYFSINRYDVLPSLCTAVSLAALSRQKTMLAAITLGLGTLLKVYPVLLAPLVLRFLWPKRHQALRFGIAYTATCLLAFSPLVFGADLTAVLAPYRFQLFRPPEPGLTIYGCLLPIDWADGVRGMVFRMVALTATLTLCLYRPIETWDSLLRRGVIVLAVFVSLAVFYSPQWIVWFIPLLAPLIRNEAWLRLGAIGTDVVNYLTFPVWFWVLPTMAHEWGLGDSQIDPILIQMGNLLRLVRFLLIGLILIGTIRAEWGRTAFVEAIFARISRAVSASGA